MTPTWLAPEGFPLFLPKFSTPIKPSKFQIWLRKALRKLNNSPSHKTISYDYVITEFWSNFLIIDLRPTYNIWWFKTPHNSSERSLCLSQSFICWRGSKNGSLLQINAVKYKLFLKSYFKTVQNFPSTITSVHCHRLEYNHLMKPCQCCFVYSTWQDTSTLSSQKP